MPPQIPAAIADALTLADPSWRPVLLQGLHAVAQADPAYLPALAAEEYLPTDGRLFAAFAQPIDAVNYVLVGEGPYPRAQSATGVCFMDGAVGLLWSEAGLSKQVNRATSLRNFMKMLLVADGQLALDHTSGDALALVALKARAIGSPAIQTLADLQANLTRHGFLLLNAALAFRPHVAPVKEARAWQPFLQTVLAALVESAGRHDKPAPTLVLWGKIAEQLQSLPATAQFPQARGEHPYNLSFIANPAMRALFGPMRLLQKAA
ncbi:uracil-DNA glycosylase [Undibacterium arcticum]|uniref:Uracil-DNA glycosylase n=1 Tax=Undibacterium arcticum TaxID=1762892 RepID=A0ABV7FA29_9BURK